MRRILIGLILLMLVVMLAPAPVPAAAQTDGGSLDARAEEIFAQMTPEQRVSACQAIEPYKRHLRSKPNLETVHACRFLPNRGPRAALAPTYARGADWKRNRPEVANGGFVVTTYDKMPPWVSSASKR